MHAIKYTLLLFLTFLMILSCDSEPKAPTTAELIVGKWAIQQGFRNGKRANSLEGLFFEFKPDNQMVSNMFGSEETSTYALNDMLLTQTGSQEIKYNINKVTAEELIITTKIQGFDFRLMLKKE